MQQHLFVARVLVRLLSGVLAALLLVAPVAAKSKRGDGDGMPTGWERRNGLSVNRNDAGRDPDSDALKNLREFREGTDPQDADTDGDGVPDGTEIDDGTDPAGDDSTDGEDNAAEDGTDPEDEDDAKEPCGSDDPDSEGDGIDNEDEDDLGDQPADPDSDNDGTIDGFEDSDDDGESDLEEELVSPDRCSNHGAAVSTAAHCPVKGRAHGKLVSGIARDKGATVEDAVAACAEALGLDTGDDSGDDSGGDDTGGDDTGDDTGGDDPAGDDTGGDAPPEDDTGEGDDTA